MMRTKFHEYEYFSLLKPIPAEEIPVGTVGVVLMVFDGASTEYEVEFLDKDGCNLGSRPTYTLTSDFMSPLRDGNFH